MSETSGQEPRESSTERPHSKRHIDWDAGEALYLLGKTAGFIASAIGVRRESVQHRIRQFGWKDKRARARLLSSQSDSKKDPEPNEVVALDLDRAASNIIALVEQRITDLVASGGGGADQIQKLTYALARAGQLRRQSRGMGPTEGFRPRQDNRLELIIRRLPATKEEYDAQKATRSQEVPA